MLIRSRLVACIYFSRRRTPRSVMVWKRGAIRCHSLEDWCDQRVEICSLFLFWSITLQFELEVMIYVRAIREGDFLLFLGSSLWVTPITPGGYISICVTCFFLLHDKHPGVFAKEVFAKEISQRKFCCQENNTCVLWYCD